MACPFVLVPLSFISVLTGLPVLSPELRCSSEKLSTMCFWGRTGWHLYMYMSNCISSTGNAGIIETRRIPGLQRLKIFYNCTLKMEKKLYHKMFRETFHGTQHLASWKAILESQLSYSELRCSPNWIFCPSVCLWYRLWTDYRLSFSKAIADGLGFLSLPGNEN